MGNPGADFGDDEYDRNIKKQKKDFKDRVKSYLPKIILSNDLTDEENINLFNKMKRMYKLDKKDFNNNLQRLNYVRKSEGLETLMADFFIKNNKEGLR